MKQLFSIDGPVMGFMSQLTDLIILSLLWLLCCIPVVTIGASTSAMYYVALKMARGELSGVAKAFFHAFKDNFGAGILYTLIFGAAGAMLCFDYLIMVQFTGVLGTVARVFFAALGICYAITMCYTYPLQAQFVNTVRGTLKNAVIFSVKNLRITLAVLAIHAVPLVVIFLPLTILFTVLPLLMLLVPGGVAYFSSRQLMKAFEPWMEAE